MVWLTLHRKDPKNEGGEPLEVAPASGVKGLHRRTEGNSALMKKAFRA
jgi:hypothetical protein